MRTTRAKLLGAAAAAGTIGFIRYRGEAAEFSYKFAANFPPTFPLAVRLVEAFDKINQASGGRLEIAFFPSGQLGGNLAVLSQLRLGAIELSIPPDADLANIVPAAGLTTMPFVAADRKQCLNILTGNFAAYVRDAAAQIGIYQFSRSWDIGLLQTENTLRPVVVPGDLRGIKLRTTGSPLENSMFKAFGATPNPLAASQIYTGIQTHLVDGATIPLSAIEPFKIYEVTKYLSLTNHIWIGQTIVANAAAWQRLPKNLQDLVEHSFEAARNLSNEDVAKGDETATEHLKSRGMLVNNADAPAFRKAVHAAGLYAQWKTGYPPEAWSLLEKSVGPLT